MRKAREEHRLETRARLLAVAREAIVRDGTGTLRALVWSTRGKSLKDILKDPAVHFADLAGKTYWSMLTIELQLHAQRDPEFSASYNDAKSDYHVECALMLEDFVRQHALSPVLPPLQIAIGLHALWSGLVVQGTGYRHGRVVFCRHDTENRAGTAAA